MSTKDFKITVSTLWQKVMLGALLLSAQHACPHPFRLDGNLPQLNYLPFVENLHGFDVVNTKLNL